MQTHHMAGYIFVHHDADIKGIDHYIILYIMMPVAKVLDHDIII